MRLAPAIVACAQLGRMLQLVKDMGETKVPKEEQIDKLEPGNIWNFSNDTDRYVIISPYTID